MNKTLGVSIPTYKRPDQLVQTVRSVAVAGGLQFDIPVFISDDSADETNASVLQVLRAEYPCLQISRNGKNLGIDSNILRSVDINTCDYVWILGEDDRLIEGAVETALKLLRTSPDFPFYFINYASVDGDFKTELKPQALRFKENRIIPWKVFMAEHAWAMGFIGGCVINKQKWGAIRSERYTGTYFAHAGHILELIEGHGVPIMAKSLVLNRCGEPGLFTWTSNFFDVIEGWGKMIDLLPERLDPDLRKKAIQSFELAHGIGSVKFLLYARADRAYDYEAYRQYVSKKCRHKRKKAVAMGILVIPPVLLRFGRFMLSWFRRSYLPSPRLE